MEKNLTISENNIYFLLSQLSDLLEQKTIKKNKSFLKLCNSILCLSHDSDEKDIVKLRFKIHDTLLNQGLYKGL